MRWNSQDSAGRSRFRAGYCWRPQRSNAPKLYIFGAKWRADFVLTQVIRLGLLPQAKLRDTAFSVGTDFPDTLPKVLGFSPPFFHIKLKNKAHRLLAGFVLPMDNSWRILCWPYTLRTSVTWQWLSVKAGSSVANLFSSFAMLCWRKQPPASLHWIFPKWKRLGVGAWGCSRFSIAGRAPTIFN